MKIFLTSDVEKVGMAGEIINVSDGFAMNYLIPRKLGIRVTARNEAEFMKRTQKIEKRQVVIQSKTSMLAEKIKSLLVTLKRKTHGDDGKLYGSVSPQEIVDLLLEKGVSIAKNQVIFDKSIKGTGAYEVTIKLSSTLKPKLSLKVVAGK